MAPANVNEANPISGRKSLFLKGFWGLQFVDRSGIHEIWGFSSAWFTDPDFCIFPANSSKSRKINSTHPRFGMFGLRERVGTKPVGTNDASLLTQVVRS